MTTAIESSQIPSGADPFVQLLLDQLTARFGSSVPTNSLTIVREAVQLARSVGDQPLTRQQQQTLVLRVLERVAAGKDGVLGTADDCISTTVLTQIRAILEADLAGHLIEMFQGMSQHLSSTGCFGMFKKKTT